MANDLSLAPVILHSLLDLCTLKDLCRTRGLEGIPSVTESIHL